MIEKGICKECKRNTYIVNKFYKLCRCCNDKRLNSNKPKKQLSKQTSKTKKSTGEREMFLEIWSERPHICVECGKRLGENPRVHFFSHIKPKSTHPELRLDKTNVRLLCWECHYNEDFR